jgi:hypothetical protein
LPNLITKAAGIATKAMTKATSPLNVNMGNFIEERAQIKRPHLAPGPEALGMDITDITLGLVTVLIGGPIIGVSIMVTVILLYELFVRIGRLETWIRAKLKRPSQI